MKLYNQLETKEFRKQLRKTATQEEKKVWNILRSRKLLGLKFFRQYSIYKYILDFYCPQVRLAIEIDGGQHSQEKNLSYDTKRTQYLKGLNVILIRFWNNEVNSNIDGVYQKIYEVAKALL